MKTYPITSRSSTAPTVRVVRANGVRPNGLTTLHAVMHSAAKRTIVFVHQADAGVTRCTICIIMHYDAGEGLGSTPMNRMLIVATLIAAAAAYGQVQGGGRGGPQGGPPAAPPLGATPKPAVPNAKPVRSCESLAMIALPDTTIESARVDPANPGICSVTAITTHPPSGDKIRIWIALPTANWNGRFLGVGGAG